MSYTKTIILSLAAVATLVACEHVVKPYLRDDVTDRLAHPVWMVERQVPAGMFNLTAYERMHKHNAPATVYIEGDGMLTSDFNMDSKNPTPRNPVSLHLATKDKSDNLVWLARPCQYYGIDSCPENYWKGERFSPEVLQGYDAALNEIKKRYDITGFNLVGFDGGGAIATILAANRGDILTLRTVAANLDTTLYAQEHKIPPMTGSLNPVDFAAKTVDIPQTHYIGGQDKVITPALLHAYVQAVGPSNCLQYHFIQEAEHEKGWVEKWPDFLNDVPTCKGPVAAPDFSDIPEAPEPNYVSPDRPEKP